MRGDGHGGWQRGPCSAGLGCCLIRGGGENHAYVYPACASILISMTCRRDHAHKVLTLSRQLLRHLSCLEALKVIPQHPCQGGHLGVLQSGGGLGRKGEGGVGERVRSVFPAACWFRVVYSISPLPQMVNGSLCMYFKRSAAVAVLVVVVLLLLGDDAHDDDDDVSCCLWQSNSSQLQAPGPHQWPSSATIRHYHRYCAAAPLLLRAFDHMQPLPEAPGPHLQPLSHLLVKGVLPESQHRLARLAHLHPTDACKHHKGE